MFFGKWHGSDRIWCTSSMRHALLWCNLWGCRSRIFRVRRIRSGKALPCPDEHHTPRGCESNGGSFGLHPDRGAENPSAVDADDGPPSDPRTRSECPAGGLSFLMLPRPCRAALVSRVATASPRTNSGAWSKPASCSNPRGRCPRDVPTLRKRCRHEIDYCHS